MDTWTAIPGFQYLEVTRTGRVRSAEKTILKLTRWGARHPHTFKAREYRRHVSDNGYMRITTQRDGKRGPVYVHRLVALAFVSGYIPGYHVNHINGVKLDNRPENLEWVPNEQNVRHAWKSGLCNIRGENAPAARLTPPRVRAIRRLIAAGNPNNTIALAAGLSPNTIWKIANGHTWQSVSME